MEEGELEKTPADYAVLFVIVMMPLLTERGIKKELFSQANKCPPRGLRDGGFPADMVIDIDMTWAQRRKNLP